MLPHLCCEKYFPVIQVLPASWPLCEEAGVNEIDSPAKVLVQI